MIVSCTACGRRYKLQDGMFGDGKAKRVRCKACNELFVVQPEGVPQPTPAPAPPAAPPPAPKPAPQAAAASAGPDDQAGPFGGGIPWEGPGSTAEAAPFSSGGGSEWGAIDLASRGAEQAQPPAKEEQGDWGNIAFEGQPTAAPEPPPAEGGFDFGTASFEPASTQGSAPAEPLGLKDEPRAAPKPPAAPAAPAPAAAPRPELPRRGGTGEGPLITAVIPEKKQTTPVIGALVLALLVVVAAVVGFKVVKGRIGAKGPTVKMEIVDKMGADMTVSPQVRYFVITGRARNVGEGNASFTRIKGTILDAAKKPIESMVVACGHTVSEEDLRAETVESLKARLQDEFGQNLSNMDVPPGKEIPFAIAFFNPPAVESFELEVVPLDQQEKR